MSKEKIKQITFFINLGKWIFIPKTFTPIGVNGKTYKWLCFEFFIQREYEQ